MLALLSPMGLQAAEPQLNAEQAFHQLTTLVGTWEGTFEDSRTHSVTYRLTAGGTTLVETWTLAPGRESLTLYHLDGDALVADHYCPQGNTPRLQLEKGSSADKLSFIFRDGTNLQVKDKSHQHAFWMTLRGKDSFIRSETYVKNGSTPTEQQQNTPDKPITYHRMTQSTPKP
ncbi:hypothetical protein DRW03_24835 [Corallococcus sp. H22C18031201]|nr:hypothetical protein DRW03_24835 [Corallococcus sp. H22C18031201]